MRESLLQRVALGYALCLNGNWRVSFKFERTDAVLVDYVDYH